jgi:hypothetical protein
MVWVCPTTSLGRHPLSPRGQLIMVTRICILSKTPLQRLLCPSLKKGWIYGNDGRFEEVKAVWKLNIDQ